MRGGLTTHRPACPCPACKARRGERPRRGTVLHLYLSERSRTRLDALMERTGLKAGQIIAELLRAATRA